MSKEMAIAGHRDDISALTPDEADKVFDLVTEKVYEQNNWSKKPKGIDGLITLTEIHQNLSEKLLSFIKGIDTTKAGIWLISGWVKAFHKGSEQERQLKEYIDSLSEKEGVSEAIKLALKSTTKGN